MVNPITAAAKAQIPLSPALSPSAAPDVVGVDVDEVVVPLAEVDVPEASWGMTDCSDYQSSTAGNSRSNAYLDHHQPPPPQLSTVIVRRHPFIAYRPLVRLSSPSPS
ncbi:hypothetical protein BDR07DRAFT_1607382, partial [Suillus spraguei]